MSVPSSLLLRAAAVVGAGILLGATLQSKPALAPHEAAQAFLETLAPEQRTQALLAFDDEERKNWHFIPKDRKGLALRAMDAKQREAALALLASSLSAEGYQRVRTIRDLELVLRQMENDTAGEFRNPDKYWVALFGTPSRRGLWGWRFEGHHLSLNWTIQDGKVVSSTPQFFGANPAHVPAGLPMAGTRALAAEEDLARALLGSLTPTQRAAALVSETAPADILTAATRLAAIQEDKGVACGDLSKAQRKMLLALIEAHARAQPETVAKRRLAALRKAGLERVKFAWMGASEPGKGHYYRVQGSTFLIEYDNTQNGANHIHSVWRDFSGDFGEDLLAAHYRSAHRP